MYGHRDSSPSRYTYYLRQISTLVQLENGSILILPGFLLRVIKLIHQQRKNNLISLEQKKHEPL